jgi:hypothetical protein
VFSRNLTSDEIPTRATPPTHGPDWNARPASKDAASGLLNLYRATMDLSMTAMPWQSSAAKEAAAVSPRPHEQHELESIEERLSGSDPRLASLLSTFTRLTAGEDMPVHEFTGGWGENRGRPRWRLRRRSASRPAGCQGTGQPGR